MAPSGRRFSSALTGRWALIGLFVLASIAALRIGRTLILPVMMAGILALLLAPVVAWLSRRRIPAPLGAAIVMLSLVAALVAIVYALSGPAATWLDRAPETLAAAEDKIQALTRPIEKLQATAEAVEDVASGGRNGDKSEASASAGGLFGKVSGTTVAFLGAFATVVFLGYFLLATAPRFRKKLSEILPAYQREEVAGTVAEIQQQMSRYLLLAATINTGVGLVTYAVLALQGMPNPGLWGAMAGVLNFIPYLGAVFTVGVIALAGLVTFDQTSQALLAAGSFFVINLIEANIVTPMLMGMRLPLNPVAIFGGLMFWGWLWGVTGAVLAVPLMVMVKVVADRVDALKPIGVMLGP